MVNNANTKLYMTFDGSQGSTTFTDTSVGGDHGNATVNKFTVNGPIVDTSVKKVGTGSLLLGGGEDDNDGDFIYYADHADWNITANFTIDCWVYPTNLYGNEQDIVAQRGGSQDKFWQLCIAANAPKFYHTSAGAITSNVNISEDEWTHICGVRVYSGGHYYWGVYVNGKQTGYLASDNALSDMNEALRIGTFNSYQNFYWGNIDELHINAANVFHALPNEGLTDHITIPGYWAPMPCNHARSHP